MRVLASAFWISLFLPVPQDSITDAIDALQARAPKFTDLELRYVGRLHVPGELDVGGETVLVIVPGKGIRSDAAILSFRSTERQFGELEVVTSTVERGEDLFFRGVVQRGPAMLYSILPPCLSMRGRRDAYPKSLDVFPRDFPFRWVADEGLPLLAASPREAFAREPGWRPKGRRTVDEVSLEVFELEVSADLLPIRLMAGKNPVSAPLKRLYVDPSSKRPVRLEVEIRNGLRLLKIITRVEEWQDTAGGGVPRVLETRYVSGREGDWKDSGVRQVKVLTTVRVDGGLEGDALLPEEWRAGIWTDARMNPAEFYREGARRAPEDARMAAHLALLPYREFFEAMQRGERGRKVDLSAVIAALERVRRLAPRDPFVVLSLLRLYEAAGNSEDAAALMDALQNGPGLTLEVQFALAAGRVRQGKGEAALSLLQERVGGGAPLSLRLRVARLRVSALALAGRPQEAGKVLREALGTAHEKERPILLDAFVPLPYPRRDTVAEPGPGLKEALEAAFLAGEGSKDLGRLRMRLAFREKDSEAFGAALEALLKHEPDENDLEEAAGLALRLREAKQALPDAASAALVEAHPESPYAWVVRALSVENGDEACARAIELMETHPAADEALDLRAEALRLLSENLAGRDREDLLRRAAAHFIACLNQSSRPYRLVRGGNRDPLSVCLATLLPKAKYVESFELLKRVESRALTYLYGLRNTLRPHESPFFREVRAHLEKTSKDPDDYVRLARLALRSRSRLADAMDLLEKAHTLAPENVVIANELAETCERSGGRRERAIEVYRGLLDRKDPEGKSVIDRDLTLFRIGRLHHGAGRAKEGAAFLDRLDLEADSVAGSLTVIARIYEDAGADARAIRAYRKFIGSDNLGYRLASSGVFARLGRLHEKRDEIEEAYAVYSRGVEAYRKVKERYGPTAVPRPPVRSGQKREETDPERLKEALLKRVGRDYFIEKLLARDAPPLDAAAREKVKDLVERLRSDSIIDRDDALAELQDLGPAAAPELRDALRSTDPEFRARVRHLLWTWAEPK